MKAAPITLDLLRHFPHGRPKTYGPPESGGPPDCVSIDVIYERLPEGDRIRIPFQVEDGDIEALQRGDHVWLTIWSGGLPVPVDVQVHRLEKVRSSS